MTWLEFIASMTGSLAWPAAVILIVWMLRKPISNAIARRLRKMTVGAHGASFDFGEVDNLAAEVEAESVQLEAEVARREPSTVKAPPVLVEVEFAGTIKMPPDEAEEMARVAEANPAAAVLMSTIDLERVVRRIMPSKPWAPGRLFKEAENVGLLTSAEFEAAEVLRKLRNELLHEPEPREITTPQAIALADMARAIARNARVRAGLEAGDLEPLGDTADQDDT